MCCAWKGTKPRMNSWVDSCSENPAVCVRGNIQLPVWVNYTMNNPWTVTPRERRAMIGQPREDLIEIPGVDSEAGQAGPPGRPKTWTRTTSSIIHTVRKHAARLRSAPAPRPQLRRLLRAAAGRGRSPPGTILSKQSEWVPVLINQQIWSMKYNNFFLVFF